MESLILTGSSILARGLISSIASEIYNNVRDKKNIKISKIIQELDIEADIQLVEALVNDIKLYEKDKHSVIQMCIQHIYETINSIKEEITIMKVKLVEYHYKASLSYYYYYFSEPNYEENKSNLTKLKGILKMRVDSLIKISLSMQ